MPGTNRQVNRQFAEGGLQIVLKRWTASASSPRFRFRFFWNRGNGKRRCRHVGNTTFSSSAHWDAESIRLNRRTFTTGPDDRQLRWTVGGVGSWPAPTLAPTDIRWRRATCDRE